MKKILVFLLLLVTVLNLAFSAFYVWHGEIDFQSDIARDFLLYQEIDAKKIILIGPRSSTSGIFHGPLWLYLTYPAYLLGQGNPITVAWFWVILTAVFVGTSAVIAKKMFGSKTALVYALLLSGNMMFQTKSLFNPHGALFLVPVYFFTIYLYQRDQKWWQLLLHLVLGAVIIQFQMAIGIPLVILSTLFIFYLIIRHKNYWHTLAFLIIPLCLANFIIFEFRHNFNMTKAIVYYAMPNSNGIFFDYSSQIDNRIERLMDLRLLPLAPGHFLGFLFAIVLFLTYKTFNQKSANRKFYPLVIYYFVGYTLLTFVNKGIVLEHQFFPILALSNLWFAALSGTTHKKLYIGTLALIVVLTYHHFASFSGSMFTSFTGRAQNSWRFLSNVGQQVVQMAPNKFGYFVYSPDGFAYQVRYALIYAFKTAHKDAAEFQKQPTTFVIAAPPPPDKPWFNYTYWQTDKIKIKNLPDETKNFPNGYLIEKFTLSDNDIKIVPNPEENIGIHFR